MMSNKEESCVDCATAAPAATAPPAAAQPAAVADIVPPTMSLPHVVIEYCDRCRWAPRASWMQTELLLTFPPPAIRTISLQPMNAPETGGRFRVWLDEGKGQGFQLMWDRKTEGGFPELKVLKQRVRNVIQPEMSLGHSDAKPKAASTMEKVAADAQKPAELQTGAEANKPKVEGLQAAQETGNRLV